MFNENWLFIYAWSIQNQLTIWDIVKYLMSEMNLQGEIKHTWKALERTYLTSI